MFNAENNSNWDSDKASYIISVFEQASESVDDQFSSDSGFVANTFKKRFESLTMSNPTPKAEDDVFESNLNILLEMFPDLNIDYLKNELSRFNGSTEATTEHILSFDINDNHIESKTEQVVIINNSENTYTESHIEYDVLKSRKNIFDNDKYDIFNNPNVDESKILQPNKKNKDIESNTYNESSLTQINKEKVLAAAALLEEDEYDDTFDEGYVDTLYKLKENQSNENLEQSSGKAGGILEIKRDEKPDLDSYFLKYLATDEWVFKRNTEARQSAIRKKMISEMNMTNEQIEGWYIMLEKTPNRKATLLNNAEESAIRNQKKISPNDTKNSTNNNTTNQNPTKTHSGQNKGRYGKNHNRKNAHRYKNKDSFKDIV
ncbi:hypothetical protein BB558_001665 [Smittium angustum]|uniref:CUE domain-containing protein n=1 Tax=Smittium angustum TaxID=133377 RepID=A0A2U1JAQ4_SMIAN|nr:hypothetical protein BB558_001665 [Smittium angustum]